MRDTPVIDRPAGQTSVRTLDPVFCSVKAAGEFLGGIVEREIYRLIDRGEITAVRHGKRRLIVVASLRGYADKLIERAAAEGLPPAEHAA